MSVDVPNRATKSSVLITEPTRTRAVSIQNLQHYYGQGESRRQVLFDNTLEIAAGEIVIMTGPSGSGKTTLLTLIGTLRSVQEGSLQVLGRELHGATPQQRIAIRRDIGFIFQAHNLFASLTALQNVRMAMELFQFSNRDMVERGTRLLERLGLGNRLHYKPDSLSGGQKQRVAIARGLAHGPRIVLADEPTAALDEKSGRDVVTLFQELAQRDKVTILIVTHDNRILDVADRIVNMVDGRIKSDVVVSEVALICEFLQQRSAFQGLTPTTLASIADKMSVEQFGPGETIIEQGAAGEKFYLVRQGEVDVLRDEGAGPRVVATLKEGASFGEQSLLTGKPRNATIKASRPTVVYALGKNDFQAALAASDSLREELQRALFERQR